MGGGKVPPSPTGECDSALDPVPRGTHGRSLGDLFSIQVQRPMYCIKGSQVVVMVGGLPTVLSPGYKLRASLVCRIRPYDQVHDGPFGRAGVGLQLLSVQYESGVTITVGSRLKAPGSRPTVLQEDVAQGSPSQRQRETRGLDKNRCVLEGR